jgi:hypothetical protein
MGRKLLPEEIQECREQGMYGSLVATQNMAMSWGGLYPDGVEEYEKLHGPDGNSKWIPIDEIGTYEMNTEQFDGITKARIQETNARYPHWAGKEVYFEAIDALRRIVLSCRTMSELYWCGSACASLDNFMEREVEGWKTVKPADIRLQREFDKVEARIRRNTVLVPAATVKVQRKEKVV